VAGEPGFQVHLAAMELAGYRTAVAESRPSALVWLEVCRFDLVVFDVELPDTDHLRRARWLSGVNRLAQSITGAELHRSPGQCPRPPRRLLHGRCQG
ncbi:hypothetical protein RB628_37975, partial [Streptomyces sp. ADMS]|nr:hypothetical protein [Streptomyces sp. ADMS]